LTIDLDGGEGAAEDNDAGIGGAAPPVHAARGAKRRSSAPSAASPTGSAVTAIRPEAPATLRRRPQSAGHVGSLAVLICSTRPAAIISTSRLDGASTTQVSLERAKKASVMAKAHHKGACSRCVQGPWSPDAAQIRPQILPQILARSCPDPAGPVIDWRGAVHGGAMVLRALRPGLAPDKGGCVLALAPASMAVVQDPGGWEVRAGSRTSCGRRI
jgi:hypothetical protein